MTAWSCSGEPNNSGLQKGLFSDNMLEVFTRKPFSRVASLYRLCDSGWKVWKWFVELVVDCFSETLWSQWCPNTSGPSERRRPKYLGVAQDVGYWNSLLPEDKYLNVICMWVEVHLRRQSWFSACELWGNRDAAGHSCQGNAYLLWLIWLLPLTGGGGALSSVQ